MKRIINIYGDMLKHRVQNYYPFFDGQYRRVGCFTKQFAKDSAKILEDMASRITNMNLSRKLSHFEFILYRKWIFVICHNESKLTSLAVFD